MRKSTFTEEQIITILREQEAGVKVMELCRKHGVGRCCHLWMAPAPQG